jgi:hypothetical protein
MDGGFPAGAHTVAPASSLRAQRSNLHPWEPGDCFVAPLLAMTPGLVLAVTLWLVLAVTQLLVLAIKPFSLPATTVGRTHAGAP